MAAFSHGHAQRLTAGRLVRGLLLLGLILIRPAAGNAKEPWQDATPEEIALTKSSLEPEAAAEALIYRVEINDQEWPVNRRIEEYIRYKIYDPEKAEKIMRLAEQAISYDGYSLRQVSLKARLLQPDGTVRKFGAESVHERDVVKQGSDSGWRRFFSSGGWKLKEKFLAVGGAVPGAILEFSVVVDQRMNERTVFHNLQLNAIPIRQFTYRQQCLPDRSYWVHALYGLNSRNLKITETNDTVTTTDRDLPSLKDEPLNGPLSDRSATLVDTYILHTYVRQKSTAKSGPVRRFGPDEPWAAIATMEFWLASDHVSVTNKVKQAAAEITRGAGSELEKARCIHDYVQQLHQKLIHAPAEKVPAAFGPVEMDTVLDLAKTHPVSLESMDFFWLAISLYRAAGIRAEELMLPNRGTMLFSPRLVSPSFLQRRAVALRIGEVWHYSMPQLELPLAFDELPWEQEGLTGLLALDQKQEFIDVPFSSPEQGLTRHTGSFRLDASGVLSGEGRIEIHGHEARQMRAALTGQTHPAQLELVQRSLSGEFEGADFEVTDVVHVDDVYHPVEITFKLTWPGFGVVADQRIIVRPFVYRTNSRSPFAAADRSTHVVFSYRRHDVDELTVALPEGFVLEAKEAPPSFPGKVLSYEVSLQLDRKHMILHVSRDLIAGLIRVAPKDYPALKAWYDAVALSDQHGLVLVRMSGEPAKTVAASVTTP